MLPSQVSKFLSKLLRRNDQSHVADDGLEHDAGDLISAFLEQLLQTLDIVVTHHDGVRGATTRDARTRGHAMRQRARSGGHEQRIDVAMITACEFDNEIATGESASQSHGAHRRFRAGRDHAHHLDRRHRFVNQFREFAFEFGRSAIAAAVASRFDRGMDHTRVRMPQNHRPPGADIVDVTVAIDVEEISALSARDEDGFSADGAERSRRAVDSAGDDSLGAFESEMAIESIHRGSSLVIELKSGRRVRRQKALRLIDKLTDLPGFDGIEIADIAQKISTTS